MKNPDVPVDAPARGEAASPPRVYQAVVSMVLVNCRPRQGELKGIPLLPDGGLFEVQVPYVTIRPDGTEKTREAKAIYESFIGTEEQLIEFVTNRIRKACFVANGLFPPKENSK